MNHKSIIYRENRISLFAYYGSPEEHKHFAKHIIISETDSLEPSMFKELISKSCLSQSRFSHLFKEQVGIAFKNYLLMKRLEKVYGYVINDRCSITDAAIKAGFSSSSHFATACKEHYGISFTDFMNAQNLK